MVWQKFEDFSTFTLAPKRYGFIPTTHQTTIDFVRDFPNPVGRLTITSYIRLLLYKLRYGFDSVSIQRLNL